MSPHDGDFPSFDLRLITAFCVVAEELHLGRAAASLGVSRRVMAAQLGDLEHQLGVDLVDRGDRAVSLTAAGERFLVEARAALERALTVGAALGGVACTELRVHIGEASNPVVRAVLAAFLAECPDVAVQVAEGSGADSMRAVEAGAADVGFQMAEGVPGGLGFAVLDRQPLGVMTRADHPIAGHGPVPWTALDGERLFVAPAGVAESYNVVVRTTVRRQGVLVREVVGPPVQRLSYLAPALITGRALLLCSRHAFVPAPPELAWTELTPTRNLEIGMAWKGRNDGAPVRRFVQLARSLSQTVTTEE